MLESGNYPYSIYRNEEGIVFGVLQRFRGVDEILKREVKY